MVTCMKRTTKVTQQKAVILLRTPPSYSLPIGSYVLLLFVLKPQQTTFPPADHSHVLHINNFSRKRLTCFIRLLEHRGSV